MPTAVTTPGRRISPGDRFDPGATGTPIEIKLPNGRVYATAAILSLLALFFLLASMVQYTSKIMVLGSMVPSTGVIAVKTPDIVGVAEDVMVRPGQQVKANDILFSLTSTASAEADGEFYKVAIKSKSAQLESYMAEKDLRRQLVARRIDDAQNEIASARAQVASLESRRTTAQARQRIANEAFAQYQALQASGFVTDGPVRDKQNEVLIQHQAVGEIEQQILTQKSRVSQAERALEIVRAETRVTEQAAERSAIDMREQLARTAVGQRQVVVAPTNAVVGAVSIQAGQSVRPGMAAVSLVPDSSKLVAELFLPVSSEGELQVGQRLYVQFDSTSKVRSPKFDGRIAQVDAVPSEQAGEARAAGGKGDVRVVRFLVELDVPAQAIKESGVPLRAGLPARAFIPQATHSILGWAAQMLVKH